MRGFQLLLFAVLYSLAAIPSVAQCPTNVRIGTPQQLEDFLEDYPNCRDIPGELRIAVWDPYANMIGLDQIRSVGGNVFFNTNFADAELPAMEGLTSIGGTLFISGSWQGERLGGLHALEHIGGDLYVSSANALIVIDGLSSLKTIQGDFTVSDNLSLQAIDEMYALETIGGRFDIQNNPRLFATIEGLSGLEEIGGELYIDNNPSLAILFGPDKLRSVGSLTVWNSGIQSLLGFNGLEECKGRLSIKNNDQLALIDGFPKLVNVGISTEYDRLIINDNPSLFVIQGFPALERTNFLDIYGNDALLGISAFQNLEVLDDGLLIGNQPLLQDAPGLQNLKWVNNEVSVFNSGALKDLGFLKSLLFVEGTIYVFNNAQLTSLHGLDSLLYVGEGVFVSSNPLLTDCSPLCNLVGAMGPGNWGTVSSNAVGCNDVIEVEMSCELEPPLTLIDANPSFYSGFFTEIDDISELTEEDVMESGVRREMVTADGISSVVLAVEFEEEGEFIFMANDVVLETPWGSQTFEYDEKFYGLALYEPPDVFDETKAETSDEGMPVVTQVIDITLEPIGDDVQSGFAGEEIEIQVEFDLVRPPVVLVHGTFSSPEAWTKESEGLSMKEALEAAGYVAFMVDYEDSNGDLGSFFDPKLPSSFYDNRNVLWENDGGIEDALEYYRETIGAATTQADVVGHSLGGILPRVYASRAYEDADHPYERKENFMEGDINRLVTIASTHFGSHLAELQQFLANTSLLETGPLGWLSARAATFAAWWLGGKDAQSPAVLDQLPPPGGDALEKIGRTAVPAHAITCRVPYGQISDPFHDPEQEYYDLYNYMSLLFYYNQGLTEAYLDSKLQLCDEQGVKQDRTKAGVKLKEKYPDISDEELFKHLFIDAIDVEGQLFEIMDGEWELPSDIEVYHWLLQETGMSDFDPLIDIFVAGQDPVDVVGPYVWDYVAPQPPAVPDFPENLAEALRFMVFNNDDNDGTVRVESQSGDLESETGCNDCVTHIAESVLHGPAPQYVAVQNAVLGALQSGMDKFNAEGFPPPDHIQPLYQPPAVENLMQVVQEARSNAICQSGMLPKHAEAYADVADAWDAVIIVRPVNPDGTALIARGAATKEMDVKPKSSNWGPQKGYLPVNQRYSKLWKVFTGDTREERIKEYTQKSRENITSGLTVARQLVVGPCNDYKVFVDSGVIKKAMMAGMQSEAESEIVIARSAEADLVCAWDAGDGTFDEDYPAQDCVPRTSAHELHPFEVMATHRVKQNGQPRYLTADYDLLMIGFHRSGELGPPDPPDVSFREGVGQITKEQEDLVWLLNRTAGHPGGDVTHHGPENQFSKSPYVDYPLTAFLPDPNSNHGIIRTIRKGPNGFRDIELKMLVNDMREKGYDLYANEEAPGWQWTWDEGMKGYQLEDSPNLPDDVAELPARDCNYPSIKFAKDVNIDCPDNPAVLHDKRIKDIARPPVTENIIISPTPAEAATIRAEFKLNSEDPVKWHIVDVLGRSRASGTLSPARMSHVISLSVAHLEPGVYTLVTDKGLSKKFVKL